MNTHIEALGWALLHSLWQGAALWIALEAVLAWPGLRSPRVRGRLAGGALAAFVLLVAATYGWVLSNQRMDTKPAFAAAERGGVAEATIRVPAADAGVVVAPDFVAPMRAAEGAEGADGAVARGWRERVRPVLPWVVAAWAAGVALGLTRQARAWLELGRLRRAPLEVLPEAWAERLAGLRTRCAPGLRRLRVGETAWVRVPQVIGGWSPVILLPAGFLAGLPPAQVEAVLAHEIAHLVRRDFWLNALQCLAEAVFFFHPAVHAFGGHIRRERERACDDFAVERTGDALGYAKALATLAGAGAVGGMALAADGHEPGDLLARIRRLLGVPAARREAGLASRRALGLLATAAAVLAYAGLFMAAPTIIAQVLPAEKRAELVREVVEADRTAPGRVEYGGPRRYPDGKITVVSELRTEDGSPVPERIVGAYLSVNGGTGSSGTVVWVKGRAEFNVEAGVISLMPLIEEWAPGLLVAHEPVVGAKTVNVPVVVLRKGSPLCIRLTNTSDQAMAGVKVGVRVRARAVPSMTSWELPGRAADAQGVITLPQAAEGFVYELTADLPGHQNTRREVKEFHVGETLSWVLASSQAITGRVVDAESGQALADVAVILRTASKAPSVRVKAYDDDDGHVTRTDADGRFTLPGWDEAGFYGLVFERSGYARSLVGARAGEVLDVTMKRGGFRVAGRVRLAPGVKEYRLTKNPLAARSGLQTGPGAWTSVTLARQICTRDGDAFLFEFDQLPEGVVRIGQTGIDHVVLDLRADRTDLDLVLSDKDGVWFASEWPDPAKPKAAEPALTPAFTGPTRAVEIAVTTPDGGSVAGLRLDIVVTPADVLDDAGAQYQRQWVKDGKVLLPDVQVGARVRASSFDGVAGYEVPERSFTVADGEGVQREELPASPAGILSIEVRDADGQVMMPDKLFVTGQGAEEGQRDVRSTWSLSYQRSQDINRTKWTFPNVPLGRTYRVLATSGARVASSAEFSLSGTRPVGEVAVRFGVAEPLELKVMRPDGGAVGKLDLTLGIRPEPGTFGPPLTNYRTDAAGVARVPEITRLAGLGYFVEIAPERDWQPMRMEFAANTPGPWTVQLTPGIVAEGRVTKADGTPVEGKQVRAYLDTAQALWWTRPPTVNAEARTDAEGRFRFSNLPSGRVKFSAPELKTPRGVGFPVLDLPAEAGREVSIVVE